MSFHCPRCTHSDTLYRLVDVPGWQTVDENLKPTRERDIDWDDAEPSGDYGCTCGWKGHKNELDELHLGIDGRPLPKIHPGQQQIEAA